MRGASLVKKLDAVLKKTAPFEYTVYKRVVTRTGGDSLTGRKGTVNYTDTVLSPQPFYQRMGREPSTGPKAFAEAILTSGGKNVVADDYVFLFSPSAITKAELKNQDVVLILKDSSSVEQDTLRLLDWQTATLTGTDVLYVVYARSTKRPA